MNFSACQSGLVGTVEAVIIAKRTCKLYKMAIFYIIPLAEDLDFIFLRLCSSGKLCLSWWQKARINRYYPEDII